MMKMIIADDESVITAGIQKLVDWEVLGIEIAGEYADGKSALEGLIAYKPDIALLDISMPGMTGVEILKECRLLGIQTQIILISGFQDFEYARADIHYGALDYLLKPVIRDELLHAIGKGIGLMEQEQSESLKKGEEELAGDYRKLLPLERGPYLPSCVELFPRDDNSQMEKLMRFSVMSFIEEYLDSRKLGIVFARNDDIVIVFKGISQEEGRKAAAEIREKISGRFGCPVGMIVGRPVENMSEIPKGFQRCACLREYFFFADQMKLPILLEGEKVFPTREGEEQLLKLRGQMIDQIIAQDEAGVRKSFERFARIVCGVAEGKKEDALFYFCSAIRVLDEKFCVLALPHPDYDAKDLLWRGRNCADYTGMQAVFYHIIQEYYGQLKDSIVNNSSRDFLKAKVYIDKHYDENLTLEVLAGEVHMNPYYFRGFWHDGGYIAMPK